MRRNCWMQRHRRQMDYVIVRAPMVCKSDNDLPGMVKRLGIISILFIYEVQREIMMEISLKQII